MARKGQMIILTSLIAVVGIVMIFNVLGTPAITEEKRFQETRMLNKNVKNIINEYKFAIGTASTYPKPNESASLFISNISSYVRNEFDSSILYTIAFSDNSSEYSIEIGNYMDTIVNATVRVTNSYPAELSTLISDREKSVLYFTSSGGPINVTLSYYSGNKVVVESFPIEMSGKKFIHGFFDLTLRDEGFNINIKDVYNRTW